MLNAVSLNYKGGRWPAWCQEAAGAFLAYLTQPRVIVATINEEDANVIAVSLQVKNTQGTDIEEATDVLVELFDQDWLKVADTAFTVGITAGANQGTAKTDEDEAALLLTTHTDGSASIDVTDVAPAGTKIYARITVMSDGNTVGAVTVEEIDFSLV
ncbi:MAG: hypothetical protein CMH57_02770 [Myxococcales bacterium]|nr:hypothetical protein [Myxococcales bacterium]